MSADVLDIFAAPATQAWRAQRPAQVRARMAWARQRLAAARAAPLKTVQGVSVDEAVLIEIRPGWTTAGTVIAFERGPTATLAVLRLWDPTLRAQHGDPFRAGLHRLSPL